MITSRRKGTSLSSSKEAIPSGNQNPVSPKDKPQGSGDGLARRARHTRNSVSRTCRSDRAGRTDHDLPPSLTRQVLVAPAPRTKKNTWRQRTARAAAQAGARPPSSDTRSATATPARTPGPTPATAGSAPASPATPPPQARPSAALHAPVSTDAG